MFCPQCGSQNSNSATVCAGVGCRWITPIRRAWPARDRWGRASTFQATSTQAILTTLCCCLPFGIVAIVFAAQVKSKISVGDYEGARQASDSARMWCWIAFGLGLVSNVIIGMLRTSFHVNHFGR